MGLESTSSQNVASDNSFFYMEGSHVFIVANGEKVNLNFDQITNVRLIKNRNLSLNLILFLALFLYSYYILFFNNLSYSSGTYFNHFILAAPCLLNFSYKLLSIRLMIQWVLVSKSNLPLRTLYLYF
jgi:hypothetical protein